MCIKHAQLQNPMNQTQSCSQRLENVRSEIEVRVDVKFG